MKRPKKRIFDHPAAEAARERVTTIIDMIPAQDLVDAIKRAPSLRGMILGYVAEELFEKHVRETYPSVRRITKHDDHDRSVNKSDRTLLHKGRWYSIQLKSMQTNSIHFNLETDSLLADVQNDASDSRLIKLPNGSEVITTCYAVGEYDILAVPLFPFTGSWDYAYKLNEDCRRTSHSKYSVHDSQFLLATTEKLPYPLSDHWSSDLLDVLERADGVEALSEEESASDVADREAQAEHLKFED